MIAQIIYVHEIRKSEDRSTVFINFYISTKVLRHSAGSVGMYVHLTDSAAVHLIVFITNCNALHMLSTAQTVLNSQLSIYNKGREWFLHTLQ